MEKVTGHPARKHAPPGGMTDYQKNGKYTVSLHLHLFLHIFVLYYHGVGDSSLITDTVRLGFLVPAAKILFLYKLENFEVNVESVIDRDVHSKTDRQK